MILLHAHAQYIYIVNAKYQKASVKALVQVDFPAYAQAKSLFESKQEKKMANFTKLLFCQKTFLLCRQTIEFFRHKLWYKLNSPHMHYLYTCHTKLLVIDKQPFC